MKNEVIYRCPVEKTIKNAFENNNVQEIVRAWEELEAQYKKSKSKFLGSTAELAKLPISKEFAKLRSRVHRATKEVYGYPCKVQNGRIVEVESRTRSHKKEDLVLSSYEKFKNSPTKKNAEQFLKAAHDAVDNSKLK